MSASCFRGLSQEQMIHRVQDCIQAPEVTRGVNDIKLPLCIYLLLILTQKNKMEIFFSCKALIVRVDAAISNVDLIDDLGQHL